MKLINKMSLKSPEGIVIQFSRQKKQKTKTKILPFISILEKQLYFVGYCRLCVFFIKSFCLCIKFIKLKIKSLFLYIMNFHVQLTNVFLVMPYVPVLLVTMFLNSYSNFMSEGFVICTLFWDLSLDMTFKYSLNIILKTQLFLCFYPLWYVNIGIGMFKVHFHTNVLEKGHRG